MPVQTGVAFLSQGKLHVTGRDGEARPLASRFAETVRERAMRMHQKNAWKSQGSGAQFMSGGALWGVRERDPAQMRIEITSVTRGPAPDDLIYSLETDDLGGVFLLSELGAEERRLFHSTKERVRDLSCNATEPRLACAVSHRGGVWNIGVMSIHESGLSEATEGDSVDRAPSWIPGSADELVFQSAGIARNRDGVMMGTGPFSLCRLNLLSGELEVIAEDAQHDLLAPRYDEAGNLYYIRRPYRSLNERPTLLRTMFDIVALPFRLLNALYHWLNFFSVRNSGQPLNTAGGTRQRQMDLQKMVVFGNYINAQKILREAAEEESPSLVPKTWKLIRRDTAGEESIIADAVLAFDVTEGRTITYTNGSTVFRCGRSEKPERLLTGNFIEQVLACASARPAAT